MALDSAEYAALLQQGQDEQPRVKESQPMNPKKKAAIAAATVVGLGALGAAGYVYREELKNFFNWNKLANGAVESSADLLAAKISLALSLCDIEPVDIEAIKRALISAKKEAQSVASINKQLQGRLDKVTSAQPDDA